MACTRQYGSRCTLTSESSVYRLIKDTDFPRPVHLASRLVVFDAAEIRQWQQRRTAIR
ncbi:AlpA family phage regulatory protein [Salmonella enterica subsp. enterica]